jgi:hypothetical protein
MGTRVTAISLLLIEELTHQDKSYLQCWVTTLPVSEPRCYGILAEDDLPHELCEALRRQETIDFLSLGRLYTQQEIFLGAWIRDLSP